MNYLSLGCKFVAEDVQGRPQGIPKRNLKMAAQTLIWQISIVTTQKLLPNPMVKNPITILASVTKQQKLRPKIKITPNKTQICMRLMGGQPEEPRGPKRRIC